MLLEEVIKDQLTIAENILEDDETPMEFDDYAHIEGYVIALRYVLGDGKAMFNKEDI